MFQSVVLCNRNFQVTFTQIPIFDKGFYSGSFTSILWLEKMEMGSLPKLKFIGPHFQYLAFRALSSGFITCLRNIVASEQEDSLKVMLFT